MVKWLNCSIVNRIRYPYQSSIYYAYCKYPFYRHSLHLGRIGGGYQLYRSSGKIQSPWSYFTYRPLYREKSFQRPEQNRMGLHAPPAALLILSQKYSFSPDRSLPADRNYYPFAIFLAAPGIGPSR